MWASRKRRKRHSLARVKPEKFGTIFEYGFIATSIGGTILSSWLTKLVTGDVSLEIDPTKQGQGVVTKITNDITVTSVKQSAKKASALKRYGVISLISAAALAIEIPLIINKIAPFYFAFIPISIGLGFATQDAKIFAFGKDGEESLIPPIRNLWARCTSCCSREQALEDVELD